MNYRQLGSSGLHISEISIGSWLTYGSNTDESTAHNCLRAAVELGVNFIDTADVYNNGAAEEVIGRFLASVNRSHLIVGSKAFFPMSEHFMDSGLSRRHLINSCVASLKRLNTPYIDLYQCHRYDPKTPLEETCFAMQTLIQWGYILHWGVSQWTAIQLLNAIRICEQNNWQKPISNQPIYNMLNRSLEVDVMGVCETENIGIVCYSPLAQGILTGKYDRNSIPPDSRAGAQETAKWFSFKRLNDETFAKLDELKKVAFELDLTLAQLALAWCLRKRPVTSVITGASKVEQVRINMAASGIQLSDGIRQRIETILENQPIDQYTGTPIGHPTNS
jgi:aryl-alcohol dehydrogenase-like predicted oxidoreductase